MAIFFENNNCLSTIQIIGETYNQMNYLCQICDLKTMILKGFFVESDVISPRL